MSTSSLPPNQDQKKFRQDEEGNADRGRKSSGRKDQPNKGYSEDQPGHPVRTTGSMRPDQDSDLSTRETGPGCDNS